MKKKITSISLPKGQVNLDSDLENVAMVNFLIRDDIFKKSAEEDLGPITRIYPDWKNDKLVYVLLTGEERTHILSDLLQYMKKIKYLKAYEV